MLKRLLNSLSRNRERAGVRASSVTTRVDDSPGWGSATNRPHDYDQGKVLELYNDALEAWRKNPIAWRIIAIQSDYLVGDGVEVTSPNRMLNRFIQQFWYHPQNRMDLRLPDLVEELARSGDLFIILFRNPADGMSYIRATTKDRIQRIETAPNDWETELVFYETGDSPGETRAWLSPHHPNAPTADAIMLHYAINRPVGALLGESDLTPMIPWLLRYSRMLEDRVKLNWALRTFLWMVTVPSQRVTEKQEQYRNPPQAGSIIIKDESEKWEVYAPSLNAIDASRDLQAVRQMIDAGSGFPPHWRGEAGDANLATAQAMQGPTERHLTRRQQQLIYMIQDILYHAYERQVQLGLARRLSSHDYSRLFIMQMPEISRFDNEALGRAAREITTAFASLGQTVAGMPQELAYHAVRLAFQFAGQPLEEDQIEEILAAIVGAQGLRPRQEPGTDDSPLPPGEGQGEGKSANSRGE